MAYLLGSKYCIESLSSDVSDLQAAVSDVISRVGPVRYPSWKFPDKISSDLDIVELLDDCRYDDEDVEDNQVAHIKLFEMVIDRMVLLLQSFASFTDQMLSGTSARPSTANPQMVGNQMSIGLVVKRSWNKMVRLSLLLQQLQSENRSKTHSLSKLENINQELQHQTRFQSESQSGPFGATHLNPSVLDADHPASPGRVSTDIRSIASQTLETSFVPCDACYQVQLSFRDVGDMLVDVCKAQGLPSAVSKHRDDQTEAVMTAADIARWRKEGEKDLSRIRAHLSNLMAQINPLKSTLEESKQSCEKLTKTLSDKTHLLSKERTERESQVAQYEIKIKNIEKNHRESMSVVERSYDDLVKGKRKIDEQVVKLKQELVKQCDALKDLDIIKKQLQKSVAENTTMSNQIVRLESDVMEMTEQLKNNHSELEDVNRKLGKEQAKNRSMEKQGQAMQIKHDILAQRADELDKDCQELRDQYAEAEDHNEDLQNKLQQVQGERKELQSNLQKEKELAETVQKERDFLEKSINDLKDIIISLEDQVKEGQERERLLVQFPERNPTLVPNPGKTGVEERDMKNQVEANSIRMQVLEEENNLLRKNISQLLDGREEEVEEKKMTTGIQINGPAIPLWQVGTNSRSDKANRFSDVSPRTQERNNLFSASSHHRSTLEPIQPTTTTTTILVNHNHTTSYQAKKGSKPNSDEKLINRQKYSTKSAKRQQSVHEMSRNASVEAYMKLKKTGSLSTGVGDAKGGKSQVTTKPAKQGWTSEARHRPPSGDSYTKQDMFICPSCDKMYQTQRDIDIHQSYCYG
ncbi:coiled-coil domain-containing protein 157-like isoform X1 [Apostichopus japonicus]|uniref:coiled-coil domain-containing protein 157-like isoform X1 n=1 Tax=Stichopus japonicus TaxID=307972 RepID=UPI003AB4B7E3